MDIFELSVEVSLIQAFQSPVPRCDSQACGGSCDGRRNDAFLEEDLGIKRKSDFLSAKHVDSGEKFAFFGV